MKLPKGKYYVGDPCYIFGESWSDVLAETDFFDAETLRGKPVCAGGTAYGDGLYEDNCGREYWVDSGMIGILPVSLLRIDKKKTLKEIKASEGMHIIEFTEETEVACDNGVFRFGNIVIDTRDDDDEE